VPFLLQNMGIEYDEAMETIHVIKSDGSVSPLIKLQDTALKTAGVASIPCAIALLLVQSVRC
jgi:hypothetical protein